MKYLYQTVYRVFENMGTVFFELGSLTAVG